MKVLPHYTKILTLGSLYTENALVGDVIIQEKIDGSQFRFGLNEDKELIIGSKSVIIHKENIQKMFKPAVEYILSIEDKIRGCIGNAREIYFFAEILTKPKHNILKYEKVPKNHIVLFDALWNGRWGSKEMLSNCAEMLDIDLIPELYRGKIDIEKIKELLDTQSYLGNEKIEGVVIKNYIQTILLGGNSFPLFTKYVREAYKERHNKEWKIKQPKNSIKDYVDGFKNENRWQKAIIHLKEKGLLTNSPKDIGMLIKTIQEDIKEEEKENIKKYLYHKFIGDILRTSVRQFPEWYKEKLLENLK